MAKFKYIYGPVSSWRLGRSLGVDLLSQKKKVCSFNCIYCQLGKVGVLSTKRRLYVPTERVISEIKRLPRMHIDYITFSGRGEPTLASNLGQTIKALKRLRPEPVAVLTNASLIHREDVRRELALADLVAVKLDAHSQKTLQLINRPARGVTCAKILNGIRQFSRQYKGELAIQIMLMEKNQKMAEQISRLARNIHADEIQINTPKRKGPVPALSRKAILEIKRHFRGMGMKAISVYDRKPQKVKPLSKKATMYRRTEISQ